MDFLAQKPDDEDPADFWKKDSTQPPQNKDAVFEPALPHSFTPHEQKLFSQLDARLAELKIPPCVVNQFFSYYPHKEAINDFFKGRCCLIIEDKPCSMGFLKPKGMK